jgi:predicted ATPase/class 3 adenylate cyclase/DNA-binding CsgD family transcriptional regulator
LVAPWTVTNERSWSAGVLPTGTITFALTDVEASTRLWDEHPATMGAVMARHDSLIESATLEAGGSLVRPRGEGDSRFMVFPQASRAVSAALRIQQALRNEDWARLLHPAASHPDPSTSGDESLHIRIGLHTGEADIRDGDYYGSAVNRCGRLRGLARGGQVLLSAATAMLVRGQLPAGASLRDLGEHQLKYLAEPERIFQLVHPDLPDEFPALASGARIHGLPIQPTPLVQRSAELRYLEGAVRNPDIRLITLIGSGGIGKTRLASAVTEQVAPVFADGVWFVDLSSIRNSELVFPVLAHALVIQAAGRRTPLDSVCDYLRASHALLVLDNLEQVIGAAPEIGKLLSECADVKVLATSREPLRLRWEHVYRVPPLSLPAVGVNAVEELRTAPAVAFFVQRAQASDPEFALGEDNARAVADVCTRLDGVPLALELAAAQMRVLSPSALLPLLHRQFDVLRGPSDAPDRQRSLTATVGWSWDLLTPAEKELFRRLSVFEGGCSADAARVVCRRADASGTETFLDLLALVDKSLLRQERAADGAVRFRLLETIQRVAFEKMELANGGEVESIRQRHSEYFLVLAANGERECWGPDAGAWVDRLDCEYANFRAALNWLSASGQFDAARGMAIALEPLWSHRGHIADAVHWLKLVTAAGAITPQSDVNMATALSMLALFEQMTGEPAAAKRDAQRSIAEANRIGDQHQLVVALWMMGELARAQGDQASARANLEGALTLSRSLALTKLEAVLLGIIGRVAFDLGNRRDARALAEQSLAMMEAAHVTRWLARVQALLGILAIAERDVAAAQRLFEQSVATCRTLGDRWSLLGSMSQLASLLVTQGNYARARALFVECADLSRGQRDPINATRLLIGFAQLAAAQQQYMRAVRLAGAADALRAATGLGMPDSYGQSIEQWLVPARSALGPAAGEAWRNGQTLSVEQVIEYALAEHEPSHGADVLSGREREVTAMLARGYSNRRIAQELTISQRTVEAHVAHIMAKLGLESRLQIAAWASAQGPRVRENTDAAQPERS